MGRKSGLGSIGMLFALIGSILMIVTGVITIVNTILTQFDELLSNINISIYDSGVVGADPLVRGLVVLLFGLVVLWSWKDDRVSSGDSMLLWSIIYIVLPFILGGGFGGLLVLIAGILLLIDYLT